ncbi:MAG: hypothetical protein KGI27_08500 [Thaumarchaeota archaeon]|nr:hypothetical protein [Nitrososphaerota archaeon]
MLLWAARLSLKKIAKTPELLYSLRLSTACVNSSLCNTSDALKPLVCIIKHDVCSSGAVNFDETSYPRATANALFFQDYNTQSNLSQFQRA